MSEEVQNEATKKCSSVAQNTVLVGAESGTLRLDASTNISQTNMGQMTASSAPAAENGKWSCETCTYENYPLSRKCTMCLRARPAHPAHAADIVALADGAAALPALHAPSHEHSGAESVSERLRPLRISSPAGPAPASPAAAVDKWPCSTCTYENWPRSLKCAMCGAPPAHPQHPAPLVEQAAALPRIGINDICVSGVTSPLELDARDGAERRRATNMDWLWLQACLGVVEGSVSCVEAYLAAGGDPARALTHHELQLLDRASAFDVGHTLVHLAIRFQREDILTTLLSRISGGGPGLKRSPSYIAPDLATSIRRHIASSIRHKKGNFPCRYINEFCTFYLPAEIEELPGAIQEQLFTELLDREAQHTLEAEPPLINWSGELVEQLGSRVYALWNRSAGDCLPDAVCQAAYGVFDRHNALRGALADSLQPAAGGGAARAFFMRWQRWELEQAARPPLQYALTEGQLRAEWARLRAAAATPGDPLHQLHVFVLAHVLRRPIIVYGVNVVHSFRGEALDYARFQGIYLPLLWEPEFCSKSPLCLGYTRGHFSALVPAAAERYRPPPPHPYICREQDDKDGVAFLPLTDSDGKLLPVHFLTRDEISEEEGGEGEEGVVRRWVSACVTAGGVLVARQTLHARPLHAAQMLEEWLNHYRRLAQQTRGPFPPRLQAPLSPRAPLAPAPLVPLAPLAPRTDFSSDADTDDE